MSTKAPYSQTPSANHNSRIIVLYILIVTYLDCEQEDKSRILFIQRIVSVINSTKTQLRALVFLYVAATRFGCYSQPLSGNISCSRWQITVWYIFVSAVGGCITYILFTSNGGQFDCLELCCTFICWPRHRQCFHMPCHSLNCHHYHIVGILKNSRSWT